MLATPHTEVLAHDWFPPVILGREVAVAEVVRRLDPPHPLAPGPWMVGVVGPRGSGTSAVARRAAREVADRVRASAAGAFPRWLALRTARHRGTHGVASALLGALDEGFDGRGFRVAEILAGFLRRVRREARPAVIVLDDVRTGGPDLGPVLRALGEPDRFLPEGESGLPTVWTVLAGTAEGVLRADAALGGRWSIGPFVAVPPYTPRALRQLVDDRAARALGGPAPAELVTRITETAIAEGGGASRAIDLLRRALTGGEVGRRALTPRARRGDPSLAIESWVVRAIEEAARGSSARLGDVRRFEAKYARERGTSPLPATTLWRRILRLEQAGYVRREVRPGGEGGTRSVVRLIAPVDEWVITPHHRETLRGSGGWPGGSEPDARGPGDAPPGPGFLPPSDAEVD